MRISFTSWPAILLWARKYTRWLGGSPSTMALEGETGGQILGAPHLACFCSVATVASRNSRGSYFHIVAWPQPKLSAECRTVDATW